MAETLTYSSLVGDVIDYCERNDANFVAKVPRFIMLAENRIATEVKGLGFIRFVSGNLTISNPILVKPARWRETAGLRITVNNNSRWLKQRAYSYLKAYWPDSTLEDAPVYYSDYDYEHFLIAPTPDLAYDFELSYFERPDPLSEDSQTNWTTQYAPQLLLYASLLEAQPFLKRPERTEEFKSLYERAASAITAESQSRLLGDQNLIRTSA